MSASLANQSRERALAMLSDAIQSGILEPSDLTDSTLTPHTLILAKPLLFEDGKESSISVEQVKKFLDRAVLIGGNRGFYVDFGDNSGKRLNVRTVREYRAALAAGFFALTQTDIKLEGYLKTVNTVLTLVESVRVPSLSFINKPFRGVCDIELLPVSLLPCLSRDDREETEAMEDSSLRELLEKREIKILSVSSKELAFEWRTMGLLMRELLRADLNGDGIEDILCVVRAPVATRCARARNRAHA
jgi:hypothetical protein